MSHFAPAVVVLTGTMMQPHTNIPMVELEAELASRDGASLCAQICEELGKERRMVEGRMASGLAPAEFERARRWCEALEAGDRVVRGYLELIKQKSQTT